MQLGTFEPILRLHSNNEDRLPWQYPQPVQGITESFLRLREALLPYTYTLAAEANQTGLPMARPLYLDYPDQPSAYQNPTEYLYGPDMLVAPVTTPGDVASTTVWFPPGTWVDFFTGATFTGAVHGHPGGAARPDAGLRPPRWDRARAAVHRRTGPPRSLTALVYPGSSGSFDLYGDAGTGLGYTKGQRTETLITTSSSAPASGPPSVRVTIGAARGSYPGEPTSVSTTIEMVDVTRPDQVTLDGRNLSARSTSGRHWSLPGVHLDTDRGPRVAARCAERARRGLGRDNSRRRRADRDLVRSVLTTAPRVVPPPRSARTACRVVRAQDRPWCQLSLH